MISLKAFSSLKDCNARMSFLARRAYSSRIAVSPDKSMILCYHPKEPFPYECSKPIVRSEVIQKEEESSMVQGRWMEDGGDGPNLQELMRMFHTTRHPFNPRAPDKFKQKIEKERKSI